MKTVPHFRRYICVWEVAINRDVKRGQKLEAEAKFLASRPVWPRAFNVSGKNYITVSYTPDANGKKGIV